MSPRPSGVETMDFPWRVMYPELASRSMISACVAGVPMPLACVLSSSNAAFNSSAFFVFMSSQRLACSIEQGRVGESCRRLGLSLVKLRRTDRGERHVFDKVGRDRVMSADIVRFVVACVLCLLA